MAAAERPGRGDDDRVVVITGASSGIGRLTALRFARRGDTVVLAARSRDALATVAAECEEAGGTSLIVPTDVAAADEVRELGRRAVAEHGRIDVWVNDAAVMAYGQASTIPTPVHQRVIAVNLMGVLYGSVVAAELMDPAHGGRGGVIVNVASLYGRMTSPFVAPYVASKFGVVGLSQVLRQELAGTGVHVCTVLPGSMDTPIFRHAANYTDRPPRPVSPVGDPDRVARTIEGLADRPRPEATVGQVHRVLAWACRLAPNLYGAVARPAMRRLGLGAAEARPREGNVFRPLADDGRP